MRMESLPATRSSQSKELAAGQVISPPGWGALWFSIITRSEEERTCLYRILGLASGRQMVAETKGALSRPGLSGGGKRTTVGSDEVCAPRVLPVACPEAGRGWPTLAHTSKLVLLLYGCFDSRTCTSIPGSSMNWQAARAMVPSMLSRQPWSTFCRIWWDTGREQGKMMELSWTPCPGLLSSALWVPQF